MFWHWTFPMMSDLLDMAQAVVLGSIDGGKAMIPVYSVPEKRTTHCLRVDVASARALRR